MDLFLAKIEDLKRHAELLKRSSTTTTPRQAASKRARRGNVAASSTVDTSNHPYPYEADGVGDWVSHFKEEAGPWTGRPLVVLSLFDGLGGIWQALTILDIPFSGYSSEVEQPAIQVVKKQHPRVKHVGDVTKLKLSDIPEKLDLVIGGFPCQDLSVMGKKEGLHGSRSKLFFQMLRVIRDFQPKWFLVENVASMSWIDREEITRHIGLPPLELDSQELTASKRRRLYWTNIPHPPHLPQLRDHPTAQLQHCLENAIAIEQKCGVILCSNLYKGSNVRLEFVLDSKTMVPRYMRPSEVEVLMGYPPDYTNVVVKKTVDQVPNVRASPKTPKTKAPPSPAPPESMRQLRQNRMSRNFFQPEVWDTKMVKQGTLKDKERWNLLGNTFSVKVIAYLTSPLLQSGIRSRGKPVKIAGSVKEEELSAMEPGDVWALYNEQGKPNWYAVIKSRTGDRFSPTPDHSQKRIAKKTPLKVEMQYLELTDNYLKNEDGWNSHRGSGLLKMRDIVDIQTSWQAFSHRVTSFDTSDDSYFVFPGKDEVWAIWCSDNQSRYFVYVEESTKKAEKLLADKPGEEGFVARCCVLLQTGEHEVFRKTETEVTFTDTEKFEFRAPFHLKHEAGLLKVEVSGLKGRMKSRAASEEELDDEYEVLPEEDNEGLTAEELILDDTVLELAELAATPNEASPPLEA